MKIPKETQRPIRRLAVEQRPEAERIRRQQLRDVEEDLQDLREQLGKLRDAAQVLAWAGELADSGALAELPISLPIYQGEQTAVHLGPNGSLDVPHRCKFLSPHFAGLSKATELVNALSDEVLGIIVNRIESGAIWRDLERLARQPER